MRKVLKTHTHEHIWPRQCNRQIRNGTFYLSSFRLALYLDSIVEKPSIELSFRFSLHSPFVVSTVDKHTQNGINSTIGTVVIKGNVIKGCHLHQFNAFTNEMAPFFNYIHLDQCVHRAEKTSFAVVCLEYTVTVPVTIFGHS